MDCCSLTTRPPCMPANIAPDRIPVRNRPRCRDCFQTSSKHVFLQYAIPSLESTHRTPCRSRFPLSDARGWCVRPCAFEESIPVVEKHFFTVSYSHGASSAKISARTRVVSDRSAALGALQYLDFHITGMLDGRGGGPSSVRVNIETSGVICVALSYPASWPQLCLERP